uniref:Uncharacterized protein n=1 Tax=Chromera velia CCMP2878 TaxID=1169474 RepID=A0A0G4FD47_9ALVE|eukprot:Cvel_16300.t1-p1 / transcript=Cvel_16300.t1 / gene=Cvel_16300 / organism=Chromera_velia_CCMP2878 / gene_product=hypothetical protein / transcript_product=hypothetical protein / location=Cvel_scaffold1250:50009-50404(-) / protein_length=132 / sequence_SO=supercontig / SO=protein_coding / is_pseudo=false
MPEWMPPIPNVCPYPEMKPKKWERIKKYARSLRPGQIREVKRGLYGMPVSSKLFDDKWVGAAGRAGFMRVELGIALDEKKNVLVNWIDDVFGMIGFGSIDLLIRHLQGEMEFGKIRKLDMRSYHFKYSGMDF